MRTSLIAMVAGLLAGLGGAIGIASFAGWGEAEPTLVTATTTSHPDALRPAAVYVAPDEVIVGQAVLVPEGVQMEGDAAVFRYELVTIAPLDGIEQGYVALGAQDPGTPVDPAGLPPVFPATWTLTTPNGSFPGTTATATSRSAQFVVPTSFSPSQVTDLVLESYRVPVPINEVFAMSESDPTFEVAPGVAVSLIQIVDQGEQTIVQAEIVSDETHNRENLTIEGVGPEWASAVREAEGRPRYNLRRVGADVPDPLILRVRGIVWLTVEDPLPIALGER